MIVQRGRPIEPVRSSPSLPMAPSVPASSGQHAASSSMYLSRFPMSPSPLFPKRAGTKEAEEWNLELVHHRKWWEMC